jgi:hypothetical protein
MDHMFPVVELYTKIWTAHQARKIVGLTWVMAFVLAIPTTWIQVILVGSNHSYYLYPGQFSRFYKVAAITPLPRNR